jgi:outer membrane protein OmpA-like peptidoglycan-associated protein
MVVELTSDSGEGSYLIPLPVNRDYALNVSYPGYLFHSENFSFSGIHEITDPFLKNVALNPIQTGEKIILRNIFFDFDEWEIKNESLVELEKIALFLKQNSSLKVEISGHTDNIGTDEYNKTLSQRRAEAVVLYLIDNGIDAHRLVSKGYGDDEPVATNDTVEGRAQNRRTEMKIIR